MMSVGGSGNEFVEGWLVAQVLGEGAYGEVRLLVHARTGESVALKTVRSGDTGDAGAAREAALHRALRHPNVLKCLGERRHHDTHYMFLEYAQGGELFDRIEPDVGMSETLARRYWRQLLEGLNYLHGRGVAHRDIKPENLLLDAQDNIKISDFGMATLFRHAGAERLLSRRCGTLPYAGPEVLTAVTVPYRAEPADLWAAGVVLLAMLAGELPWEQASNDNVRYSMWCSGTARGRPWDKLKTGPLALLRRLLSWDPKKRPTLSELARNSWISCSVDETDDVHAEAECRGWCSQPTGAGTSSPLAVTEMDNMISYSQPTAPDDLLLSTQNSPTTQPQNVLQRLVRRMTRVWVCVPEAEALAALEQAARELGFECQMLHTHIMAMTCGRVGLRAWAVRAAVGTSSAGAGAGSGVLLEFRRSRGCGLEFKRTFLKLRAALTHIAVTHAHAHAHTHRPDLVACVHVATH